ncbi:hypothetical protein RUND412_007460 [Rhizina undulata]
MVRSPSKQLSAILRFTHLYRKIKSLQPLPPEETITGVRELVPGVNPEVDIVAVHGLRGHAYRTWTALGEENNGKRDVEWLKELLPREVPNARILTYGYDSDPAKLFDKGPASTNMILDHAKSLVTALHYFRRRPKESKRPIIFICHSLGGIVVKRALIYSAGCNLSHNIQYRSIKISTHGIIFMGTPHAGSELAKWGKMAEKLIRVALPKKWVDANNKLIKALDSNSETLLNITDNFLGISNDFKLFFFYEELRTEIPGFGHEMVVERTSAVPTALPNVGSAPIHATHSKMCKFYDVNSPGWDIFRGVLVDMVTTAQLTIALRWVQESRRQELAQVELREELMLKTMGPRFEEPSEHLPAIVHERQLIESPEVLQIGEGGRSPVLPYEIEYAGESRPGSIRQITHKVLPLVKTLSLWENDYCEGRESEMETIHKILHDPKKRVVCITSVTGGGKTHLARQYFFTRDSEFPGGRFWVDCKLPNIKTALDLGYCKIAEDLNLPMKKHEDLSASSSSIAEDFSHVKPVADWFGTHNNWLLVFDGVEVSSEEERQILSRYVPKGKGGSIIITTLNVTLAGAARIGSPERLELEPMKDEEAVRMLLHYAQINKTTEKEQKAAEKLVKALGNLPLAIHSAGSYIKSSRMPIADYLKAHERNPFGLKPVDLILDQIEERHPEAYNLLRILAFIHREIPVQMLLWGIRLVRRDVQLLALENGRRDFNNTIANLMTYSLLDRTPVEDLQQSEALQIDTLMFHSVVQNNCIMRMHSHTGELKKWLELSIRVACGSFDKMNTRERDAEYLVSDYRRYEVHLERLLNFANKYKSPSAVYVKESLEIITAAIEEDDGLNLSPIQRISMFASMSSSSESAPETPSTRNSPSSAWIEDHDLGRSESPTRLGHEEVSTPTPKGPTLKRKGNFIFKDLYDSDVDKPRAPRKELRIPFRRPRYKFRWPSKVEKYPRYDRSSIKLKPPGYTVHVYTELVYGSSRPELSTNAPRPPFSANSQTTGKSTLQAYMGTATGPQQTRFTEKKRNLTAPVKRPQSPQSSFLEVSPHSSPKLPYDSLKDGSEASLVETGLQFGTQVTSSPTDYRNPQPAIPREKSPLRGEVLHKDIKDAPQFQMYSPSNPGMYQHHRSASVHSNPAFLWDRVGNGSADFKLNHGQDTADYALYESPGNNGHHGDGQSYPQDYEYVSWEDTVRGTSPFDPGFVPSMDLSNSPSARGIVGPRRHRFRPPSVAYSEPIKEFASPFPPPGGSTPLAGSHGMRTPNHSHYGGSGIPLQQATSSRSTSPFDPGASSHPMSRQISGGGSISSGRGSPRVFSGARSRSNSNSNYVGYRTPSPHHDFTNPSSEQMTRSFSDNTWNSATIVNSTFTSPQSTQVGDSHDWHNPGNRYEDSWAGTSSNTPPPTGLGIENIGIHKIATALNPQIPSVNIAPTTPDAYSHSGHSFYSQEGLIGGFMGLGIDRGPRNYYPAHQSRVQSGGLSTPRAAPQAMGGVEMARARSEPGRSAYLYPPPRTTNVGRVDDSQINMKRGGSDG